MLGLARGGAALVLLACGATPPCSAQSRLEPPDLDRYVRWGPLRARPGIQLTDFGYDDNILSSASQNEIADTTATVSPGLEGLLLFGSRAFLTFDERLGLTGYLENSELSYVDQLGQARVTVPLGRVGAYAALRFDRTRESPIDLEDVRAVRTVRAPELGLIVRPGGRTEIEIGYTDTDYHYSDPDFVGAGDDFERRLGRAQRTTALEADYSLVGRTRLTLDAETGRIDFDDLDDLGRNQDSTGFTVLPGLDFGERGALAGAIHAGWVSIDAEDARLSDYSGFAGDARLAYRPVRRATLELAWRRKPGFSVYEDATYFLDQSTEVGGVYYVAGPMGVESSFRLGRLTFPAGGADRVDRIREATVGTRLRLSETDSGRRVEYDLSVTYYEVDSNVAGLDRDRLSAGLGAVVGY